MINKTTYKELPEGMFKTINKARKSISKYSATNYYTKDDNGKTVETIPAYEETFAEAVSDYITNGEKAQPYSKAIVNMIKDIINDF